MAKQVPKVRRGERFDFRADVENAIRDAANAHARQELSGGAGRPAAGNRREIVRVENAGGTDAEAGAVLGISGGAFAPSGDDHASFLHNPVLIGVSPSEPDHVGRFVVTLEPIAYGKVGLAVLAGLAAVQIDVEDADVDGYADCTDGVTDYLLCGVTGSARVLCRENAGTGQQWAYVLLGGFARTLGTAEGMVLQMEDIGAGVLRPAWDYARLHP